MSRQRYGALISNLSIVPQTRGNPSNKSSENRHADHDLLGEQSLGISIEIEHTHTYKFKK